jgi:proline iminopeptidase
MRTLRLEIFALISLVFSGCALAQDGAIPREGFTLHYRTEGTGKPIIFLSGGPGFEVDYMKAAAELFPASYQRVFLEQRGTGRSRPAKLTNENMSLRLMVEDLDALRIHLKLDRLLIAGHSWGGMLAMAYAAYHPEEIERLILIDSGGPTLEFREWFGDNVEARLRPEDKEAYLYWKDAAKRDVDSDKTGDEISKAILPGYFFDRSKGLAFVAAQPPKGRFHQDAAALLDADLLKNYDLRAGLQQLTRPVLIVQGHQDPIGDKTAEDIHRLIRSSTLRYISRCGHFPWIEQPVAMRNIVAEFLNSN